MLRKESIPNAIVHFRLAMVPVVLVLISYEYLLAAGIVFALASLSDALDGYFARRWNLVNDYGKLMDPLADKLLVCSVMILLTSMQWLPAWLIIVLIGREIAVTQVRSLAAAKGVVIQATWSSKWKTIIQMPALVAIVTFGMDSLYGEIGLYMLYASLVPSLIGAWEYTRAALAPAQKGAE